MLAEPHFFYQAGCTADPPSIFSGSTAAALCTRTYCKSMTFISENTRALLLLTAPLIVGTADGATTPVLSLAEFNKLAGRLKEMEAEPVDLGPARSELLPKLLPLQSPDRLE